MPLLYYKVPNYDEILTYYILSPIQKSMLNYNENQRKLIAYGLTHKNQNDSLLHTHT